MPQLTRSELHDLTQQRIADDYAEQNTAERVREVVDALIDSVPNRADDGLPDPGAGVGTFGSLAGIPDDNTALLARLRGIENRGPNSRPDGFKSVRCLTPDDPRFEGGSDQALSQLDTRLACLGTRCAVEFEGKDYVLRYDGNPARPGGLTGGLQTWRDGRMAAPSPLVPGKWVAEDSPSAQVKDYTEYPAGYNFPAAAYVGAYVSGQTTEQFFKRRAPGGVAPGPTNGGDGTYWELVSGADVPMAAAFVPLRALTAAEAQAYDPDAIRPIDYSILRPGGNVTLRGIVADGANNLPGGFSPVGVWQQPDGTRVFVSYDLATDTPTPFVGGPWQYVGDPANNNVAWGTLPTGTTYGANSFSNTFGPDHLNNAYGAGLYANTFGADHGYNTYGPDAVYNTFGPGHSYNTYGANFIQGQLLGPVRHSTFGDNITDLRTLGECQYVEVGDNCARVELYNCSGAPGSPFVVPAGTTDAVYRNGVQELPIAENRYGTHPALTTRQEVDAYLLGGITPAAPAISEITFTPAS